MGEIKEERSRLITSILKQNLQVPCLGIHYSYSIISNYENSTLNCLFLLLDPISGFHLVTGVVYSRDRREDTGRLLYYELSRV